MIWNPVETAFGEIVIKPNKGTYWVTVEKYDKTRYVCEADFTIDYSIGFMWVYYSYNGEKILVEEEIGKVLAWMPIQIPEPFSG